MKLENAEEHLTGIFCLKRVLGLLQKGSYRPETVTNALGRSVNLGFCEFSYPFQTTVCDISVISEVSNVFFFLLFCDLSVNSVYYFDT